MEDDKLTISGILIASIFFISALLGLAFLIGFIHEYGDKIIKVVTAYMNASYGPDLLVCIIVCIVSVIGFKAGVDCSSKKGDK